MTNVRTTLLFVVAALGFFGAGNAVAEAAALSAPTNVVATASSNTVIVVAWSDSNTVVTGFSIERSLKPSDGFKVVAAITGANVRSYQDTGLTPATTYYYRVRAVKNGAFSRRSAVASATTLSAKSPIPTSTRTATPVRTATPTPTITPTTAATRTATVTPVRTATALPTATRTATAAPTVTRTATAVVTATRTATPVPTPTRTATPVRTATPTPAPVFDPLLIGYLPGIGAAEDVSVVGTTAFVASDTFGLSAVDVSAPSSPMIGGTPTHVFAGGRSATRGSRALVSGMEGGVAHLWVLDVSTARPQVVGELVTTSAGAIQDVALNDAGTVAVAAFGANGIWVIDLANPAAPVKRGVYDTSGVAMAVALNGAGTVAYVADGAGGVKVVSLSSLAAPTLVGSLAISGGIQRDIVVVGSMAYVLDQTGRLFTLDISTPSAPRQIGSVTLGQYAFNLAVDGTRAVVHFGNSAAYLGVIDVSSPTAPVVLGSVAVDGAGGILGLALTGGRAYVADGASGLKVYDITQPSALAMMGAARDVFTGTHIAAKRSISVVTGTDVTINAARVRVVDTSDPTQPKLLGTLPNTASAILDVALNDAGTIAVAALGTNGIWVIDLSNPAAPVRRGVYDTAGVAMGVALNASGTVAYVADGTDGVNVVSLASLTAPTLVGTLAISGGIQRDIAVVGSLAYVLDQTGRLATVDVSTASAPRVVGTLALGQYAFNLGVDGARAVVHYGNSAANLGVIDVSSPTTPVLLGSVAVDAAGGILGVTATGGRAYVADGPLGLKIYDISQPSTPRLVGAGYTVGDAKDVAFDGTRVQSADASSTVSIVDLFGTP